MGRPNSKRQQRTRRRQRDAQISRARERLAAGDLATSRRLCDALLKQQPQCPDAGVLAARIALARGRTEEGIAALRQILAHEPAHADARLYLARGQYDCGQLAAAQTTLDLASIENDAPIYHLYALIALARGDYATACARCEEACSRDVTCVDYILTYCAALARSGQLERSREVLQQRVLGQSFDSVRAWQGVANVAELLDDAPLAARAWSKVAQRDPQLVGQTYESGLRQFSRGEFPQAAHSFRICWRLAPSERRVVNALLSALRRLPADNTDPQLEQELTRCLAHEGIDPNHLRDVASRHLLRKPAMIRMLAWPFAQ